MNISHALDGPHERCAYAVTMVDDRRLVQRLTLELLFLIDELRQSWPELRRHPIGFGRRIFYEFTQSFGRWLRDRYSFLGVVAAITIVVCAIVLTLLNPHRQSPRVKAGTQEDNPATLITVLPIETAHSQSGVGEGQKGRVGFEAEKGEGSKRDFRLSHGGGASGRLNKQQVQQGRLFLPSEIPAMLLERKAARNPVLPLAGINIDPTLWKAQPLPVYGDPRSSSTAPSHGPGDGGNFGSRNGSGIGEGDGPGFGPGANGNIGGGENEPGGGGIGSGVGNGPGDKDRVFRLNQVNQRARVISKPEPQYTEEARRHQITGTVVLRVIFSSSGQVTNIRTVQSLPFGLIEKAISAARQIRFSPAIKDGQAVSVYMQLEYNFNLY
ncbi:MAG TPA: energy transducer TonB [Pyrinomonadaceae bacterium]|nr:energy transducer TonB [Pyrinomonadaceae bacterium]